LSVPDLSGIASRFSPFNLIILFVFVLFFFNLGQERVKEDMEGLEDKKNKLYLNLKIVLNKIYFYKTEIF